MAGHGQPGILESAADKARFLREEGLTVIPLGSPNEVPPRWHVERCANLAEATEKWPKTPRIRWQIYQQIAVSDEQFESWVMQYPGCNWAILTGKLVVVDADSADSVAWCESGAITRSPRRVRTAKGCHYYYLENPKLPIRNTANPAGKIDTRGHGGYVVAPGSVHATGVVYTEEVLPGIDALLSELPMLTADDLQAIKARNGVSVSTTGETLFDGRPGNLGGLFDATAYTSKATGEPVQVGGRNNAAASLAGQYIRAGDDLRTVKAKLDAWNHTNAAPLPQAEINTTIASVAKTHARNTGEPVALVPGVEVSAVLASELPGISDDSAARWGEHEPAPREWLWRDWIPMSEVTGLYAAGGTGKTLFAQQLATSVAAGVPFMGFDLRRGKVLGIFCEDDDAELHRRQTSINRGVGIAMRDLGGFIPVSRVGEDNLLITFKQGVGTLRPFWHQIAALLGKHRPALLIIDTAADTFPGNQNDTNEVRQYVKSALARFAVLYGCAVMVCAHPSKAGIQSGSGDSGNVAWENSMRSRMYMTEGSGGMRTLTRKKANYAPREDSIEFFWDAGAFIPAVSVNLNQAIDQQHQAAFLSLIDRFANQQTPLSTSTRSGNYAPKLFSQYAENTYMRPKMTLEDFEKSMHQLLDSGAIKAESDSRKGVTSRLVRA